MTTTLSDQVRQGSLLQLKALFLVLNLAEIQNLIDESGHTVGIPLDNLKLTLDAIRHIFVFKHVFDGCGDQRQGCPQFVGNIRKEAQLQVRQLLFQQHLVLEPHKENQQVDDKTDHQQAQDNVEDKRPNGLPKGGQHLDI